LLIFTFQLHGAGRLGCDIYSARSEAKAVRSKVPPHVNAGFQTTSPAITSRRWAPRDTYGSVCGVLPQGTSRMAPPTTC